MPRYRAPHHIWLMETKRFDHEDTKTRRISRRSLASAQSEPDRGVKDGPGIALKSFMSFVLPSCLRVFVVKFLARAVPDQSWVVTCCSEKSCSAYGRPRG